MVVAAVVLLASLIISACGSSDTARQTTHHAAQTPQATASWEKTTEKSPSPAPTLPPTAAPTATPTPTAEPTPTPTPAPVQFAVIGDYGMAGLMAEDVSSLVKSWQPDFIVTTGDNNYPSGGADTIDINVGQYYHEYIYPYDGGADAALAGHHHVYERLVLDGFPYFVNGLGGGSRYAIKDVDVAMGRIGAPFTHL
jgi:hypothetical protein